MTNKYEIRLLHENGNRGTSFKLKSYETAKRKLRKFYEIFNRENSISSKIVAYQIVNLETGTIVEQSGRM
jgi:hypothetical protein